jgi:hypothetical protein
MGIRINTESAEGLLDAVRSNAPSKGFTHTFYRYPARFSPEFARLAIRTFTKPGDVILDPFMGSGTVLVEALVAGRHAIGSDISSLAHFITKVKTAVLTKADIAEIVRWSESMHDALNLRRTADPDDRTGDYAKYLPWTIKKTIGLGLEHIDELRSPRQQEFARCALLRTAQWALDCTTAFPVASHFRQKFDDVLRNQIVGMEELASAIKTGNQRAVVFCLNVEAGALKSTLWQSRIQKKPRLVVTSPPYPNVHVLYHRWQVKGRRETPAPFWIAGTNDGQGESYYTMGSRSRLGERNYFNCIQQSFAQVHKLLADDAIVVQLIAFSNVDDQLPKYLNAMDHAGFREIDIDVSNPNSDSRVWRQVPLRKWYASLQGKTSGSRELLLVHKRIVRNRG